MFLTGLPRERVKSNMTMGNHKDILIKKYILRLMCWGFQGPRFCPEEHTSHTTDKNVF